MRLSWYLNRLKLISPSELLLYRVPQLVQLKFLGRLQQFFTRGNRQLATALEPPVYSNLEHVGDLRQMSVFGHEIDVFGVDEWRHDFINTKTSPLGYYASINKQNFSLHGDIKVLSEISRLQHLPFLALEGESQLYVVERHLKGWLEQNPYLGSIHWKSGIEVAIRAVNIVYLHQVLKAKSILNGQIESLIIKHIALCYRFLKSHLSLYSSANNHLIAELTGLIVISRYFHIDKKARRRRKWRRMLFEQIRIQILPDGANMELSARYHAEVMDHLLNAVIFLQRSGETVPKDILDRLRKGFDLIDHIIGFGAVIEFGDSDDGHLIRPYFEKYCIYRSLLTSAQHSFGIEYANTPSVVDSRNRLIFGESVETPMKPARDVRLFDRLFPHAGFCFFYDASTNLRLYYKVGRIGDDLSAAHGHGDVLHFSLDINGIPFLVDTGTFQYHERDLRWRNYFRGTTAHNTIAVEGQSQAKMNTRMSWLDQPAVRVLEFVSDEEYASCEVEHDGYSKRFGFIHRRGVNIKRGQKQIFIKDHLDGSPVGDISIYSYLHCHPDIEVMIDEKGIRLTHSSGQSIHIRPSSMDTCEVFEGDESQPLGWYSASFNQMQPTKTVRIRISQAETEMAINY